MRASPSFHRDYPSALHLPTPGRPSSCPHPTLRRVLRSADWRVESLGEEIVYISLYPSVIPYTPQVSPPHLMSIVQHLATFSPRITPHIGVLAHHQVAPIFLPSYLHDTIAGLVSLRENHLSLSPAIRSASARITSMISPRSLYFSTGAYDWVVSEPRRIANIRLQEDENGTDGACALTSENHRAHPPSL